MTSALSNSPVPNVPRRLRKLARKDVDSVLGALERAPEGVRRKKKDRRRFADPGYLPDGLGRFPLDSRADAAAAWRHLSQPANAILYSPVQLKRIFGRITKTFREFGVPSELANRRTMLEMEAAVEERRLEIERCRKVAAANGVAADKHIRQRTGLDDHLELGEYKRPKRQQVPAGPVTRRSVPPAR
jgi:hypothetical protein